jgi:hypothetical protein
MSWIKTEDGAVNLLTARKACSDGKGHYFIYDAAGERHEMPWIRGDAHFLEETVRSIVVPPTGTPKLTVIHSHGDDRDPEILPRVYPIIAWHLTADYAEPIIPGKNDDPWNVIRLLELPDGAGFLEASYDGHVFATLDDAKKELIERVKQAAEASSLIKTDLHD